jgi:DNA-binding transcriptional MerR regulator
VTPEGLLKMSELAERSGVSAGTIKHYLREGLLGDAGEVVRTSRNMAWYPSEFVERVRLIKRLQEERFLPLRVIRRVVEDDPQGAAELAERALALRSGDRVTAAEVARRADVPVHVLDRLAELGVLTPSAEGLDADDVKIVEAIGRFRDGGFDERLGFTVFDTLRYLEALAPLVHEEVRTLLDRLAGAVEPDRAAEIIAAGADPLRELIGAMHAKLLLAELERAAARAGEEVAGPAPRRLVPGRGARRGEERTG